MVARWIALRNNNRFVNNYINPQAGNTAGGTVFFDQCSDTVDISGNHLTGPSLLADTSGLELWGRNIDVKSNTIIGYPADGIDANSVATATIEGNVTQNNGRRGTQGGIVIWTAGPGPGCDQPMRDSRDITVRGNTSTGQHYGILFGDRRISRNVVNGVRIESNVLYPSTIAEIGVAPVVALSEYVGPNYTGLPITPEDLPPRALPVDAVSPVQARCSNGSRREVFRFSASDVGGAANIQTLEGMFSISGNDDDGTGGPDAGYRGCHSVYLPSANVVVLDGPNGGYAWVQSSVVRPGGFSITNRSGGDAGYCTIHAGSQSSKAWTEGKIVNVDLDIEFFESSSIGQKKHIYSVTSNANSLVSNGSFWTYRGWWATP